MKTENISVVFDTITGYTKGIYNPQDSFAMNWVLDNSQWGAVDNFDVYDVTETPEGIIVQGVNASENLQLMVEKSVSKEKYTEKYKELANNFTCGNIVIDNFLTKSYFLHLKHEDNDIPTL